MRSAVARGFVKVRGPGPDAGDEMVLRDIAAS